MSYVKHLPFLERLNPEQKRAVSVTRSHLRVLAGAGSGKTQVVVCRVAWLIETEKLFPSQICVVTFSNKAAQEVTSRLGAVVPGLQRQAWVGTFHNLAHRLLRRHYEAAGLEPGFQIMDANDQQRRIKRVIRELNLDESRFSAKSVQWFINQQKDEGKRPHQLDASFQKDPYQKTLLAIYQAYEKGCETDHVLDFSDLLLRSYELLDKNREILKHYHERFRYILVDEVQDTSGNQYEWLRLLVGPDTYLTIVGDDDQSIYGWRGAKIENIYRFEKDFPSSETVRLEQNYRSTRTILSAANALIANNQNRLGKNLWTSGDSGKAIQLYEALSELDEARFIVERIQIAKEEGASYQDIALLYRSNAQSRVLEDALIQAAIPYRVYGGLRFFERAEIKDALAYLRLVNRLEDNAAFERIINTPARGIGEKTLDIIRDTANRESISYYEASERLVIGSGLPTRGLKALREFLNTIRNLKHNVIHDDLGRTIEKTIQLSGLSSQYQKETSEQAQARLDNLNELIYAARAFVPDTDEVNELACFLNKMTLDTGEYQSESGHVESVQLMTLHASKGLEFPRVFLTGLEEGLFPSHLSLNNPRDIEEERRLCYVGMTRAMQQLYLTYAQVRSYHGSETYRIPSRFIEEIPIEFVKHLRTSFRAMARAEPKQVLPQASRPPQSTIPESEFSVRQRVSHPKFGQGVITNFEGEGSYTRIQVKFDTEGSKWLILRFAKLTVATR